MMTGGILKPGAIIQEKCHVIELISGKLRVSVYSGIILGTRHYAPRLIYYVILHEGKLREIPIEVIESYIWQVRSY